MEATGIIALVRATTSTALRAHTLCVIWKDAPRDVFFLRDELDTYKSFFESIQGSIVESAFLDKLEVDREPASFIPMQKQALRALLTKGASLAQALGEILVELVGEPTERTHTVGNERLALRKKVLWLRRMDNVTNMRKMLRRTVDNIALCLTMLDLQLNIVTAAAARGAPITATIEQSELNIISRLEETVESSRLEIEGTVERARITLERGIQSYIDRQLEASLSAITARLDNRLPPGLQERQRQLEAASESFEPHEEHLVRANYPHSFRRHPNTLRAPALYDSVSRCRCKCHSSARRYTSRWEILWLQHILGSFSISYSGPANTWSKGITHSNCQSPECRAHVRKGYTWVIAQYQFPAWLARSIISLYFLQDTRPELLVRIHRIFDTTDRDKYGQSIFAKVNTNDIRAVKRLLVSCPSLIHDINPRGLSALRFAVELRSDGIPMVKLLLQAGADPFQEFFAGTSPIRAALRLTLVNRNSSDDQIAEIMPFSDLLEVDGYTELHRSIIGAFPIDVRDALMNPVFRHQINTKTVDGTTPLHLAVQCCNGTEVKLLLDAGADPNAKNRTGHTPLIYACQAVNKDAFEALIAAGASLFLSHEWQSHQSTLLHETMNTGVLFDTTEIIDTLLEAKYGININSVDILGMTPLIVGVYANCCQGVRHLIRKGANMDVVDNFGETALLNAITLNSHQSISLLLGLDSGTRRIEGVEDRYRIVNGLRGWGILQYLAQYGDREMMEIFTSLQMTGLPSPESFRDMRGRTAGDIFRKRVGGYIGIGPRVNAEEDSHDNEEDELVKAWCNLLASINIEPCTETGTDDNNDEGDSDEEFFDASEG